MGSHLSAYAEAHGFTRGVFHADTVIFVWPLVIRLIPRARRSQRTALWDGSPGSRFAPQSHAQTDAGSNTPAPGCSDTLDNATQLGPNLVAYIAELVILDRGHRCHRVYGGDFNSAFSAFPNDDVTGQHQTDPGLGLKGPVAEYGRRATDPRHVDTGSPL